MPILIKGGAGSGGGYKYPTRPISNADVKAKTNGTIDIRWQDPDDATFNGKSLGEWNGTLVICKQGSPPVTVNDGEVVVDSKIKNQFKINPLNTQKGGKGYYYGIFPYTKDYVVDNRDLNVLKCNGVLSDNSWSDIVSMINSGANVKNYFDIGDEKEIVLNGTFTGGVNKSVIVQIAGFNHDDLSSGSGKASVTFVTKPNQKIQPLPVLEMYGVYTNSEGVETVYSSPEDYIWGNNGMLSGSGIIFGKLLGYNNNKSRYEYTSVYKEMAGGSYYNKFFKPILDAFPTSLKNGLKSVKKESYKVGLGRSGNIDLGSGNIVYRGLFQSSVIEEVYKLFPLSLQEVVSKEGIQKAMPYFTVSGTKYPYSYAWTGYPYTSYLYNKGKQYDLFKDIENVLSESSNADFTKYKNEYSTNKFAYMLRDCVYNGKTDNNFDTAEGNSVMLNFSIYNDGGNRVDYNGNHIYEYFQFGPGWEPIYYTASGQYLNYTETMFGFCI